MNKLNISQTITLEKKVVTHHIRDGSELILAEIQANTQEERNQSLEAGYTIDDQEIINNYATELDTSLTSYPSAERKNVTSFYEQ
jgi:hypothetical protein